MRTLKTILRDRLSDAKRIAVLGVGSMLRADDVSGSLAAGKLKEALSLRPARRIRVKIFFGETAPENLTGDIKRFKPSHLIIIDTLDAGKKAGSIFIFRPEDLCGGTSFSTHKMPSNVLVDYLMRSCACQATIIGIQPKTVVFGRPASKAVIRSAEKVAAMLMETMLHE